MRRDGRVERTRPAASGPIGFPTSVGHQPCVVAGRQLARVRDNARRSTRDDVFIVRARRPGQDRPHAGDRVRRTSILPGSRSAASLGTSGGDVFAARSSDDRVCGFDGDDTLVRRARSRRPLRRRSADDTSEPVDGSLRRRRLRRRARRGRGRSGRSRRRGLRARQAPLRSSGPGLRSPEAPRAPPRAGRRAARGRRCDRRAPRLSACAVATRLRRGSSSPPRSCA